MEPYTFIWLFVILFALWAISKKCSYFLKMAIFFAGNAMITTIVLPFLFLRPKDYRNAMLPALVCRLVGRVIGVKMELKGLENINKNHGAVIIINHQSALDLLCLAYLWPVIGRATVVAKIGILYLPFFGLAAYLWGTLFINRKDRTNSVQALGKEAKAISEQNAKLLIFPEGSRNDKPDLLPFKRGPFHLALDSKCTIQPVVISNYYFIDWKKRSFGRGNIIVNILPEISTSDYSKDRLEDLMHECHSVMQKEYSRLNRNSFESRMKTGKSG